MRYINLPFTYLLTSLLTCTFFPLCGLSAWNKHDWLIDWLIGVCAWVFLNFASSICQRGFWRGRVCEGIMSKDVRSFQCLCLFARTAVSVRFDLEPKDWYVFLQERARFNKRLHTPLWVKIKRQCRVFVITGKWALILIIPSILRSTVNCRRRH